MENEDDGMARVLQRLGLLGLGACLLALHATGQANRNCPWINQATASGLLGGEAASEVSAAAVGGPTVCTFTQQAADLKRTLRVTVGIATDPHARLEEVARICGTDLSPIKAIGNEAMICAADDRKGGLGEHVVGRVRDQVLTITIASSRKADPILNRDALKTKISAAAEQVAGNLF
jgi:hypothetical protein